jgi:hypothetical protein
MESEGLLSCPQSSATGPCKSPCGSFHTFTPRLYLSILNIPSHLHLRLSSAHKNNALKSTTRSRKGIALRHDDVWGSGCIDPRILDLGTSWRWVITFTPQLLYSRGKSLWYTSDRRLDGPQNRSGWRREEKNIAPNGTRAPSTRPPRP